MLSIQAAESTPAERYLVQSSLSGVIRVRGGNGGDGGNGHTRRHRERENGTRAECLRCPFLRAYQGPRFNPRARARPPRALRRARPHWHDEAAGTCLLPTHTRSRSPDSFAVNIMRESARPDARGAAVPLEDRNQIRCGCEEHPVGKIANQRASGVLLDERKLERILQEAREDRINLRLKAEAEALTLTLVSKRRLEDRSAISANSALNPSRQPFAYSAPSPGGCALERQRSTPTR